MNGNDGLRPVYRRLRDHLAAEIAQHRWRPGNPIPTEMELAAKFEVAVSTIRRAVDILVLDGLVERVQGSGAFVRRPTFETAFVRDSQCYGSAADRRALDGRILDRRVLAGPHDVTTALWLDHKTDVIRLLRLRSLSNVPVLFEEIWLDAARFSPIVTMKETEPRLMYPLYESLCGEVVARVEETITIGTAGETDTAHLGLAKGSSVMIIDRMALGYDGRPIEWRRSRGSASDFRYNVVVR